MIKYKFSPDRIVNTDESGVSTVMQAPRIITKSGMKQVGQCVSSERGTLVTFCGIITATGVAIPPLYIFPRVRMKDQYMYGSVPGAIGRATKSGWMSAEIFVELLGHIEKHMDSSTDNLMLLLVDNHETHVSLNAINYYRENSIVMLHIATIECSRLIFASMVRPNLDARHLLMTILWVILVKQLQ
ncbi:hypothetical protein JTB14_017482 [Gonioctena quinquepunctata]|nr:hypothetical protein JTB14_017482 [Gonioctena quinquepunctata]